MIASEPLAERTDELSEQLAQLGSLEEQGAVPLPAETNRNENNEPIEKESVEAVQPADHSDGSGSSGDSNSGADISPVAGPDVERLPGELAETSREVTGEQVATTKVSKPKKARRSLVSKVLNFPSLTGEQTKKRAHLLTGEQKKLKRRKQKTLSPLLTGEQTDEIKHLLPMLDAGFYWEAPADAKGFKIKLRWRDAEKKLQCYVFRRLGKFELQTLRKGTYEEQRSDLADRLTGELIQNGRTELTARIKTEPQNHSRSAHPNSAIA